MQNINIPTAELADLPDIIKLYADDILGSSREQTENNGNNVDESYYKAFAEISADKNNMLVVAEYEGKIIGTLQITFIYNISFKGAKRALIEGVHVDKNLRSQGIGSYMMEWAIVQQNKIAAVLCNLPAISSVMMPTAFTVNSASMHHMKVLNWI